MEDLFPYTSYMDARQMRILQLHSEFIEYQPIRKEISDAEEAETEKVRLDEVVVVFVTVEEGDDETVGERAVEEVKTSLQALGSKRILIYPYSHLSSSLASPQDALKILKAMESYARKAGLEVHRSPFGWNKSFNIKIKGHPLAEQSKTITVEAREEEEALSTAVKVEEKLKSTWYIIDLDGMLIPVDKYDFTNHQNLEKLARYETSKVRAVRQMPPHVSLMKRLGLVDYEPGSDPGNLRFYPKGRLVKSLLEQYVTQKVVEYGGVEVETPIMYDAKHPSLASYLNRFPARQYIVRSEDRDLFLRFSACFGQFLMVKDAHFTRRQMPLRIYELTRYSFRREKSGELVGLRRLRAFTMPDCHAICADLEQAKKEAVKRLKLSKNVLEGIGLSLDDYEMAIRFTKGFFEENSDFITQLIQIHGKPVLAEMWSERFFYFTFKWEFNFIDNLGKASALSTDQFDVENAERYGISFIDEDGEKRFPIILHCSPSGAIERCIYALLEKAEKERKEGKPPMLPVWLSPTMVRLVPISSTYLMDAEDIASQLEKSRIRVDIDDRDETVSKRIRDGEREWIPYILVIGEKERALKKFSVREREAGKILDLNLKDLITKISRLQGDRPFLSLPPPRLLSMRPQYSS